MPRPLLVAITVAGTTAAGLLLAGHSATGAAGAAPNQASLRIDLESDAGTGHPDAGVVSMLSSMSGRAVSAIASPVFDPPDQPLASGSFVNFESPPVRALALSPDGTRLFVTNTPNNSLVVFDTTHSPMIEVAEIPVGLDPVSVALQPGTDGARALVANFISDSVSVVDLSLGRVVETIEVGDEPVNILFDDDGSHAFVIVQGTPSVLDTSPGAPAGIVQEGAIVSIDMATNSIVRSQFLDMHTPRAAAWVDGQIAVAALHSGNNTTVVGQPFFLTRDDATTSEPAGGIPTTGLAIVQFFSETAPIFADPLLSPWPDLGAEPAPAPLVQRIVPDAGVPSAWTDIVDYMSTPTGDPDPVVVANLKVELETLFGGAFVFTNVEDAVAEIIHDAKDTVDNDIALVNTAGLMNPVILLSAPQRISNVGTTLTAMAVNPITDDLLVANLEALNTTRLEPNLRGHFIDHMVSIVDTSGGVTPVDLHQDVANFDDASVINPAAQASSLSNPTDIVVSSDGTRAFVAALGTGRVGMLDGFTGDVIDIVDVGRGTRALALDEAGSRLYTLNRTDLSISIVDVSTDSMSVLETRPLFSPEPPDVRNGRDFLYSARFSNNFSSSCGLCHIDARLDHIDWDLGNPDGGLETKPHVVAPGGEVCEVGNGENHPLKGPMFTLSLQGLKDHTPLHWRGDRVEFNDFNGAFDGLLGGSELSPGQMQAYTDFVNTIVYPPTPLRNRDNSFVDAGGDFGRTVFVNSCNPCHQLENDGAMAFDCVVGDAGFNLNGLFFGQIQLTTQLRGFQKKLQTDRFTGFGLVHDGREERDDNGDPLDTFLQNFFQGIIDAGNDDELKAFMMAYPTNVLPVVGMQAHVDDTLDPGAQSDIDLMISQSGLIPSRNDVIARGVVDGVERGYMLVNATTETFRSDTDELLTLTELEALLGAGDELVFTAVPPGSGERMGINQDLDCELDGLDPFPQKSADFNLDGVVDGSDLAELLSNWGDIGAFSRTDLNDSGGVKGDDLADLLAKWGVCP